MTLVVAGIEESRITIVADSKVTFADGRDQPLDAEARHTYFNAVPKIVLLRHGLAVGVSSNDDVFAVIEWLTSMRHEPVEVVLNHVASEENSQFVVAALNPRRLWQVRGTDVEERAGVPAWGG